MRAEAIVQLANALGCEKVRPGRRSVLVTCPLSPWTHRNGTDRHPGLSIIIDDTGKSGWRCHACDHHGTLEWLVTKWGLLSRRPVTALLDFIAKQEDGAEAVASRLEAGADRRWAEPPPRDPADDPDVYPEVEAEAFAGEVPQYAIDRGLSLDTCRAWQLGYDRGFGRRPVPRLVFPVRRRDGALVGLVGRAINDGDQPKYYNYWSFAKSKHLYGIDKVEGHRRVVLVEGMIDVLRWWEYGLPAAGLIGSKPSRAQMQIALGYERVYLALDKDEAGEQGERSALKMLAGRVPVYRVPFPAGKADPKDLTREEALAAVDGARRVL